MTVYFLYLAAALYLGILTSISPCPLATNIAAVSYVGRRVGEPKAVIWASLLYTLGRAVVYVGLAVLLANTAIFVPGEVQGWLQKWMPLLLGPVVILLGMFLVGLITTNLGGARISEKMQQRIDRMGIWGALPLGSLFAIAFCPVSAIWFFGLVALILGMEARAVTARLASVGLTLPAASLTGSTVILPLVFGIATALPVIVVAFLLAYSAESVGRTYNILSKVEWWARQVTGWALVVLGVYFSFKHVFEVI